MTGASLEVEVKVALADVGPTRARLLARGAASVAPRTFEDNVLFDTVERSLAASGRLLRVRRCGGAVTLTYKEPPAAGEPLDPAMKVLREVECSLSGPGGGGAMEEILRGLGLRPIYRYQKYREVLDLDGVAVALDETPIGAFLELEGAPDRIRAVAASLGMPESSFLRESYRALHLRSCAERGAPPGDLVFEEGGR